MDIALHLEPRFVGVRYQAARAEALAGDWSDIEHLVLGSIDPASPFSYWADRFRLSLWRGNADWIDGLDVAHLTGLTPEETKLAIGGAFVLRERKSSADVGAMLEAMRSSPATTARSKTLASQLEAEGRAYIGNREGSIESIGKAIATGLFDAPWLERCPVLASVRDDPALAEGRILVRARARAVLVALRS